MYGPKFIRIPNCMCGKRSTIYVFTPYTWDGMDHEIEKHYFCEPCADKYFADKRMQTIKQMEINIGVTK